MKYLILISVLFMVGCECGSGSKSYTCNKDQLEMVKIEANLCNQEYNSRDCLQKAKKAYCKERVHIERNRK